MTRIPANMIKHWRKLVHVEGWNPGCKFHVVSTANGLHTLRTPKTDRRYQTRNALLFLRRDAAQFLKSGAGRPANHEVPGDIPVAAASREEVARRFGNHSIGSQRPAPADSHPVKSSGPAHGSCENARSGMTQTARLRIAG